MEPVIPVIRIQFCWDWYEKKAFGWATGVVLDWYFDAGE